MVSINTGNNILVDSFDPETKQLFFSGRQQKVDSHPSLLTTPTLWKGLTAQPCLKERGWWWGGHTRRKIKKKKMGC